MDAPWDTKVNKVFPSQKLHSLINAFLFKAEPLLNFRCYELKNLFYQTVTELFLSEIEILAWLMYIEEIGINVHAYNVKEFLIFVGLHAKINLGSEIKKLLEKFKEKDPRIIEKFEAWSSSNKLSTHISTIKLGKKYRELSIQKDDISVNYNFYLNDILRSCTIYHKQTMDNILDLSLDVEKGCSKKTIFQIKKKQKLVETQEYNLNEFDRIDN